MLTYCLWGCEEEKTLQYVNNPAINFTGGTGLFSFIATPDLADTVLTVGLSVKFHPIARRIAWRS